MNIGILDLAVIYALPAVLLGLLFTVFFSVLYVIVKRDTWRLPFAEDVRYNLQLRKQPVTYGTVAKIMMFDSGVQAAFFYRCGRYLHLRGLDSIAAVLHKVGRYVTSVDLPPTAKVGPGVVFLHCCNIVIGPYIEIGSHVVFRPFAALRGWGTVKLEDDVRTGLQTCVMDCVTMGRNSESAPGAIVTQDVPPDHIAFGTPAKRMIPKPLSKLQGVIIELENVLLESSSVMDEALLAVLRQVTGKSVERLRGRLKEDMPPEKAIRENLAGKDPRKVKEAVDGYVESVRTRMGGGLRLLSSGRRLVEKIRERGLKVAVISRQPDELAVEVADCVGLGPLVDAVFGADSVLSEWKPEPWIIYRPMRQLKLGVERVIYIGGSRMDLRAGVNAAVRMYYVPRRLPERMPRKGLVDIFPDLEAILAEFGKPTLPPTL